MKTWTWVVAALGAAVVGISILGGSPSAAGDEPQGCIACHEKSNPGLVEQWRQSRHAHVEPTRVGCEDCHGSEHTTAEDAAKARTPTPNTCKKCHFKQVKSFLKGKHALAEDSVRAIPMFGEQPEAVQRMACLGCHKVGQKWEDGSIGRCDSCHTRHHFSKEEARRAEACETCHMGEDHSQYEMWRSSKHGVIHHLMPDLGRAPVCSTCHMQDGDHAVMTGWGFLGLRVGIEDAAWQEDVMTIVKAIGPWGRDEEGMQQRVEAIQALKLARLDAESFQERRETMLNACEKCHTRTFGKEHLENADQVIRETTRLMAEAVRIVDSLYADGILPQTPDGPKHTDLLLFYESPTEIEQELYRMFLFHRQKAFQGAIHANPDYMHWYGWAPMKSSFRRIQELAAELRAR